MRITTYDRSPHIIRCTRERRGQPPLTFDIRIDPIVFAEGMDMAALDLDPVERDVLLGLGHGEGSDEPAQH